VHKIEIRRARCFKDSVAVFAGKGHAVWRQPLKVRAAAVSCLINLLALYAPVNLSPPPPFPFLLLLPFGEVAA
jgi:hypothetical protein